VKLLGRLAVSLLSEKPTLLGLAVPPSSGSVCRSLYQSVLLMPHPYWRAMWPEGAGRLCSHPARFRSSLHSVSEFFSYGYWGGTGLSQDPPGRIVTDRFEAAELAHGHSGQPSGRQRGCAGEETVVSHKAPRATAGKLKANELDSSDSGGPGAGANVRSRFRTSACTGKGTPAQGPVGKFTTSTGEHAASSRRRSGRATG
jgi:hypothetical protein